MNASRLAWPEDRRLFRGARRIARGASAAAVVLALVAILAIGWGGIA